MNGKSDGLVQFMQHGNNQFISNPNNDSLTLKSTSSFATAQANCGVFKGKWMYEVQLLSKVTLI